MSCTEITLEFFRVFLSWPVMILVLSLIFFFKFKDSISDFLRRITKVGTKNVGIEATSPSEQSEKIKESLPATPLEELRRRIRENPDLIINDYTNLFNSLLFERAFNVIFGTQIDLLEHLSQKGEKGDMYINLIKFYNEFVRRTVNPVSRIENYFGFLINLKFIEYIGVGSELSVKITPQGVNFLSYLKNQYPLMYKSRPF
jgi:hypothetical protein